MKKIIFNLKNIAIFSALSIGMASCNDDYFDAKPDNLLSIESIFSNKAQTQAWWAGLFSAIPDMWGTYPYGMSAYGLMSDEMDASNWPEAVKALNTGGVNADGSFWFDPLPMYEKIRLATIFLENVDKNTDLLNSQNGSETVKQYKAEAKFLRAYYYWLMMKHLGPVPIQPLKTGTPSDNYQIARTPWDEEVKFVMDQMEEAKQDLPVDFLAAGTTTVDGTQIGRINKMIIQAVQSQIMLYSASPLFNGNTEFADWKNLDGTAILPQTYDASKWAKAASYAKSAIDMAEANGKALYKAPATSDPFVTAYNSVKNLYWDGWRTEGIWMRPTSDTGQWSMHAAPRSTEGTAYNGLAVVQSLVDDFAMRDGSSINSSSTYKENTFTTTATPYYVAGTNTMYTNREPRFYAWVSFSGAVNPGKSKAGDTYIQFFNTGTSGKAGAPRDFPKTGYTVRKNIHPTFSMNPFTNPTRPAMLIRLAELYLNYAEALNESQPGNPDILLYLNRIRNRAGLPDIAAGKSQGEMREIIRRERRIELSFEGHRFFDVRRWKIADQPGSNQGGDFFGMNMDKGTSLSDPAFYVRTKAFTRAPWQRKSYFSPFRQNEMDRNKLLVQVPGF